MNKKLLDFIRHLSEQDKKTLSQKVLKAAEELGELSGVALPYDNAFATTHRFITREEILEESVDLVLCALSVAYDLKFTDEEIESMMVNKSAKWAGLQAGEKDLKYPIPFEIHVTVAYTEQRYATVEHGELEFIDSIDKFKQVCSSINVKPILLDLHTKKDSVIKDLMTSSVHFGTNTSAYNEAMRIATELRYASYDVIRVKIETVPWHPASPKLTNNTNMPTDCYFEAHIPVIVDDSSINTFERLRSITNTINAHLSNNTFKVHDDGSRTVMITYRMSQSLDTMEAFDAKVNDILGYLKEENFPIGKTHKEFSIYDTKVHHDAEWLLKSDK